MDRKKLTDILLNTEREELSRKWGETKAAEDFGMLPAGEYIAHIVEGTLDTTRNGKPEYRLTFRVAEGEHTGRRFWHHAYLTPAALPMAKRDLAKLGVTNLDQLDAPLPEGIRCKVKLALRRDDDGNENNRVRSFEVIGLDKPEPDTFAPKDDDQAAELKESTSTPAAAALPSNRLPFAAPAGTDNGQYSRRV